MKTEMKMELWSVDRLRPAEYNPRVELKPGDLEYEEIKNSIRELTYASPIIVNSDGTVISGHQRLTVLKDLGYTEVHVVVVELDKDREKTLNIALNKIDGRWDTEKLRDLLSEIDFSGIEMSLTGFTHEEFEDLCVSLEVDAEAQEDEDFDVEKAYAQSEHPRTRRGDIWVLGNHRLMCGDSTDASDVAALMDGAVADLVITDPPYNVDYIGKSGELEDDSKKIANDAMDESQFYDFLVSAYEGIDTSIRPGAAIYIFHADTNGFLFRKAWREVGWKLAQCLIWEKNTFVMGRQDYQWRHEPILYGWKAGAAHYFVADRTQDTILYEDKPNKSKVHPTMKPVPLIGRLMKNSSKPGWNVLDLFGGSGTTLIAAQQLGRNCYMMEMDERFCDVIVKRWEEYTGCVAGRLGEVNTDDGDIRNTGVFL